MTTAVPDAVIPAQWSAAVVLEYSKIVERQRPDLEIPKRSRLGAAGY
jgi:hypothetical protein